MKCPSWLVLLLFTIATACQQVEQAAMEFPQVQFAQEKINQALRANEAVEKSLKIEFRLDTLRLGKEEYQIQPTAGGVTIMGGDANGLMYGGFAVAEQIELEGKPSQSEGKPYLKKRGIKFNIPLDARTPSYDDTGDAAQANYAEMWDWGFWEEYLDELALHRYNVLSLWNPHPFPSMVKLPNFPDVALDDVYVTTLRPIGKENEWAEPQMVSSNVIDNLKLIKTISIEEKIAFWKKIMEHARDRGIEIYFITWNLCANGAAKPVPPFYRTYQQPIWEEEPGKHGITNQMNNPINVDYYRESVKTFLLTYPLVKGIGVTAGEHMLDEAGGYTREQWIWEAYGQGMMDARKANPTRDIDFIHRVWNTNMDKIMHYWDAYDGSFEVSFKYAKARLYSSPYLHYADQHMEGMKNYGLKSWWNLRNDDIFIHRWGDPDYVRAFLEHFPREHTAGYYMGSDGYVWGREFTSKSSELAGQLEVKKHWYNFMLWGRLGYNPDLDRAFFVKKLAAHFPETDAALLYEGWQQASRIIPQVNVFHWRNWDYQWSVEGCIDERIHFHDVLSFIDNPTISKDSILNPLAFAKASLSRSKISQKTPLEVAHALEQYADATIQSVDRLSKQATSVELSTLLDDMLAMAYLGQYYARKISAATDLAFFAETKQLDYKQKAIEHLQEATSIWDQYRKVNEKNYRPQMLARTKRLDMTEILEYVKQDISLAENFQGLNPMN